MSISIQKLKSLEPVTAKDDERLKKEAKSEYNKEYNSKHKEERKAYDKKYREEHKEEKKEWDRQYYSENAERLKKRSSQWFAEHKEEAREYNKQYGIDNREKLNEQHKQYRKDNPEIDSKMIRKCNANRRKLGYEEILPPQPGCVMHHVDDTRVIPIPIEVHRMFLVPDREEHRRLIDEWMFAERPDLWSLVHPLEAVCYRRSFGARGVVKVVV